MIAIISSRSVGDWDGPPFKALVVEPWVNWEKTMENHYCINPTVNVVNHLPMKIFGDVAYFQTQMNHAGCRSGDGTAQRAHGFQLHVQPCHSLVVGEWTLKSLRILNSMI